MKGGAGKLAYAAVVALILASALWQWQQSPTAQQLKQILPSASVSIPAAPPAQALDVILSSNLWDQARGRLTGSRAGASADVAKQAVQCRLKGIAYAQLAEPQAMFDCDKKLILLHEGDVLPDKGLLREIHADHVVLERVGEMHKEYLFGKKQ